MGEEGAPEERVWDLLVVGGGPAGLTAAIYGARAGLDTAVIERGQMGGQMATAHRVANYPGFPDGIEGAELAARMYEQARCLGAEFLVGEAGGQDLDLASPVKTVAGHRARRVVLATGARPRRLGIPGEERLLGRGVSYCATCDGPFFRGRRVMVIGGGDSAVSEALFLAKVASQVIVVHRRDRFRAAPALVEGLLTLGNVETMMGRIPVEIEGDDVVRAVAVRDPAGGPPEKVEVDGVFIYVGLDPETGFLEGQVDLDRDGYIITDTAMRTRLPGVYAAGDVRAKELRQVVTATADGALAAMTAERDLAEDEHQQRRTNGT